MAWGLGREQVDVVLQLQYLGVRGGLTQESGVIEIFWRFYHLPWGVVLPRARLVKFESIVEANTGFSALTTLGGGENDSMRDERTERKGVKSAGMAPRRPDGLGGNGGER